VSTANQHSITALCGNREEDVEWRCSRDANEVKAGLETASNGKWQAAGGRRHAARGTSGRTREGDDGYIRRRPRPAALPAVPTT